MPSGNPFSVRARSNPVTEVIRSRWRVRGDSEARGLPTHGSPPPYRALPYLTRPRRSISLSRCRHVLVEASPNPVPTIDASERRNETRWRMCLHLSSEPVKAALFVVPAQRRDQRRANDPARVLVAACRSAAPGNEREDERQHDQCSHELMVPRHAPTTAAGERTTEARAEPIDPRDALDSSGDVKHGPSPRTWGLSDLNPPLLARAVPCRATRTRTRATSPARGALAAEVPERSRSRRSGGRRAHEVPAWGRPRKAGRRRCSGGSLRLDQPTHVESLSCGAVQVGEGPPVFRRAIDCRVLACDRLLS
jgi:hypothetical protein